MQKIKPRLAVLAILASAASFGLPGGHARADIPNAQATVPSTAAASAEVDGFRSARFGMDEAELLRSLAADFHVSGKQLQYATDPETLTETITIQVPGLLNNLGNATVRYTLGYKSHRLTEIVVAWDSRIDPTNAAASLVHASAMLQGYFLHENFPAKQVSVDQLTPSGDLLVFRGADASGHVVALALQGTLSKPDHNKKQVFAPNALTVAYLANPAKPDIFVVQKGSF
jgi:hypothetical protein